MPGGAAHERREAHRARAAARPRRRREPRRVGLPRQRLPGERRRPGRVPRRALRDQRQGDPEPAAVGRGHPRAARSTPCDTHAVALPDRAARARRERGARARARGARCRPSASRRDPRVRLRHGHGHTQEDMWAIKHGRLARVPDLVVWPASADEVRSCSSSRASTAPASCPYGGGTNVTDALRCPADERRTIVSLDLRRMNRVLWIDPVNRTRRDPGRRHGRRDRGAARARTASRSATSPTRSSTRRSAAGSRPTPAA